MKSIRVFLSENFQFLEVNFSIYLNRHVFVMCVTSKASDQDVHTLSTARVLVYPSLDSPEAVEGTCDQRKL